MVIFVLKAVVVRVAVVRIVELAPGLAVAVEVVALVFGILVVAVVLVIGLPEVVIFVLK